MAEIEEIDLPAELERIAKAMRYRPGELGAYEADLVRRAAEELRLIDRAIASCRPEAGPR